jgi:hypothetical protein
MLRELDINEKFTIIIESASETSLKPFIERYSLCKCVHEILIVWNGLKPLPNPEKYFKFAHTHSKVTVIHKNSEYQAWKHFTLSLFTDNSNHITINTQGKSSSFDF